MALLWVFLGGGLGSICRFGIAKAMESVESQFPWATLVANALACVILGALVAYSEKYGFAKEMKWALMTGFCGGFSTFSTFSSETYLLFQTQPIIAILNILGSVLLCLICIYLGVRLVG